MGGVEGGGAAKVSRHRQKNHGEEAETSTPHYFIDCHPVGQ